MTRHSSRGSHRSLPVRTGRARGRRPSILALGMALLTGAVVSTGVGSPAEASESVVARDDFARTSTSGWGAAPVGGAYAATSTRGVQVAGARGVIDLARAGEDRTLALAGVSSTDTTLSTSSVFTVLPTAGSGVRYALRVRKSGNRSYDAIVRVVPGGTALLSLSRVEASGQRTRLTDDVVLSRKLTTGTTVRLSASADGTDPVALSASADLVERVSRTTVTSVPAPTAKTAAAVARAERALDAARRSRAIATARLDKARARVKSRRTTAATKKVQRAESTVRTTRAQVRAAETAVRTARSSHDAMRRQRIAGTSTVTVEEVVATRTVTARDASAERITTPGHVAVWAYTSTDTPSARIALASLRATGRTRTAAQTPANVAPVAAFVAATSRKSLDASFDASESSDRDGTIASYAWRFGDGATASGRKVDHTYALPGTYTVTLVVTDDRGATHTTTRKVEVTEPNLAPAPGFTSTQQALDVDLDASSSADADGRVVDYAWDLGDGNRARGPRVAHSYARGGSYRVVLVVTDDDGATATLGRTVVATDPPPPNEAPRAAFTETVAPKGLEVVLDASASDDTDGQVVDYAWTLGDGSTATGRTVRHTYTAAGSYTVKLTVTDDDGATATTARTIVVRDPNTAPVAAFDATARDLQVTVDGSGSQDADGSIASHRWDFGDGSTGTGATATRTYATAGTYTVRLTVTDDDGATATTTRTVTVKAPAPPAAVKPTAANTGVPAGVSLKRHDGDMVITKAGTVIDSMDIYGFVTVKAPDVVIKRSRVRGGKATGNIGLITNYGYDNLLVEDVDLSPDQPSVWVDGLKGWDFTARRIHVVGGVDSVKIHGDNARVEDSLLENTHYFASDPNQGGGPTHNDNVQVLNGRNIHILRNTIRGATNMAIYAAPEKGPATVWANGNWVDGGHCTMKYSDKGGHGMTVFVEGNRFGPNRKVQSCVLLATPAADFRPTDNTWESNGNPVPILRKAD